jgi:hypothetical protein
MSFKSYRNSRSKFRRINRNDVSVQAEPCELLALLSASAITVGMAEVAPCDATENVDEAEFPDDSVPVGKKSSFDELEFPGEDCVVQGLSAFETPPSEYWDPSWAYQSFIPFDGVMMDDEPTDEIAKNIDESAVVVDDTEIQVHIYHSLNPDAPDDGVVLKESIASEDTPPVDGWDPSWLYRTVGAPVDRPTGLESHPDEFVMNADDPLPLDQLGEDGLGCGVAPEGFVEGDVPVDSGNVAFSVPQIRFLSAAGGSEVQRSLASSNAPAVELPIVAATSTSGAIQAAPQSSIATSVVPVQQVSSSSLFNSSRDKAAIEVALTSPLGSESIGDSIGTKSSSTPKRSKTQLQSTARNSDETSGLESLSPLIGDGAESPETDLAPRRQDVQTDEQVTAEQNVTNRNENVDSRSSVVVQSSRPAAAMIDEVMSQYAEISYNA